MSFLLNVWLHCEHPLFKGMLTSGWHPLSKVCLHRAQIHLRCRFSNTCESPLFIWTLVSRASRSAVSPPPQPNPILHLYPSNSTLPTGSNDKDSQLLLLFWILTLLKSVHCVMLSMWCVFCLYVVYMCVRWRMRAHTCLTKDVCSSSCLFSFMRMRAV